MGKRDLCDSCKKLPAQLDYDVDANTPKRICYPCFGKYEAKELNARLGLRAALALLVLIVPSFLLFW